VVYDCRYPDSLGGAERWLGCLARELASRGATVTYLHGAVRSVADDDGVHWVGLTDRSHLYTPAGVRRTWPALLFAWRLIGELRRRPADLVYVHDMPIFPVLAAAWAFRGRRVRWVVEWIEWWDARYWRSYAGRLTGTVGALLQRLALRLSPVAVCSTDTVAALLRAARPGVAVLRLPGLADLRAAHPPAGPAGVGSTPPRAVFVGRLIPHKGALLAVAALAHARTAHPTLTGRIIGSGPQAAAVAAAIEQWGLSGVVELVTDADDARVRAELAGADVLIHPSVREGFGLVVVEANAVGTPVVLLAAPDNAAVELLDGNAGGVAVPWSGDPIRDAAALAAGIGEVIAAGTVGRQAALANAQRCARTATVERSAEVIWSLAVDGAEPAGGGTAGAR